MHQYYSILPKIITYIILIKGSSSEDERFFIKKVNSKITEEHMDSKSIDMSKLDLLAKDKEKCASPKNILLQESDEDELPVLMNFEILKLINNDNNEDNACVSEYKNVNSKSNDMSKLDLLAKDNEKCASSKNILLQESDEDELPELMNFEVPKLINNDNNEDNACVSKYKNVRVPKLKINVCPSKLTIIKKARNMLEGEENVKSEIELQNNFPTYNDTLKRMQSNKSPKKFKKYNRKTFTHSEEINIQTEPENDMFSELKENKNQDQDQEDSEFLQEFETSKNNSKVHFNIQASE